MKNSSLQVQNFVIVNCPTSSFIELDNFLKRNLSSSTHFSYEESNLFASEKKGFEIEVLLEFDSKKPLDSLIKNIQKRKGFNLKKFESKTEKYSFNSVFASISKEREILFDKFI